MSSKTISISADCPNPRKFYSFQKRKKREKKNNCENIETRIRKAAMVTYKNGEWEGEGEIEGSNWKYSAVQTVCSKRKISAEII